ncbi:MAG TPA: hypothetical protein VE690_19705 [Rhodopila sp.]|nr:hypothetical protein [Rhodopila sp.]
MPQITRRTAMAGLLGSAVGPGLARADASIPPEGIGNRLRHLSYSDQGGRPDGVQVMLNRRHVYVGHMFSNGITVLDAADPRALKPAGFWTAGDYTRTHHIQVANDLLLAANGANIVAMQSYDSLRGYFENNLADSITNRRKFRSGLSIHDISRPADLREIAFLEMPGLGINRLWWVGGRYAYVSAHFDGFTDHILCIVDLQEITKPVIVSKWWLPGMNRGCGEQPTAPKGKRYALHHMIVAGRLGYGAWRDGGFTIHDISDPTAPRLAVAYQLVAALPRRHPHAPAPARASARGGRRRGECRWLRQGHLPHLGAGCAHAGQPRAHRDPADAGGSRLLPPGGTFGPHNLHENRSGSFQSENLIFATYQNAGVRVFDIADAFAPREIAFWVPPVPTRLIDPRPNIALAAKTCDNYVTPEGIIYVSDWNAGLHVLEYKG